MAMRPGMLGLNDPDAFQALESTLRELQERLSFQRPSKWPEIAAGMLRPQINGREVRVDLIGDAGDDRDGDVVMRACLPFRGWPLGGWVVYEAWRRTSDGSWSSFTEEQLAEMW